MGSKANRTRKKWQDYSGRNAGVAEQDFHTVFKEAFRNTSYQIRSKPNEFNNIYMSIKLSKKEQSEIYTPDDEITKHGVVPDYAIDNVANHKTL
jgi:hypothetical protein